MRKYLISNEGKFYKANLHSHSNISDGALTPLEMKELYKANGYSVIAYTDHDVMIPHPELSDGEFLALTGFEMEINEPKTEGKLFTKTCHICFVGIDPENLTQPMWHRSRYLFGNAVNHRDDVRFDESQPDYERVYSPEGITEIMNKGREAGFFVTYNHPHWSREDFSNYNGYWGMHAFEIMNGSCNAAGFEDYNPRVYDDMLKNGKRLYCVGADDNHNVHFGTRRNDSGWGFTVIKAKDLEYKTITSALLAGDFYASEGPEIYELWYEDGFVHVKTSDADRININFMIRKGGTVLAPDAESVVNEAKFAIPDECGYFRITVVDKTGKHACTNAYFMDEILK